MGNFGIDIGQGYKTKAFNKKHSKGLKTFGSYHDRRSPIVSRSTASPTMCWFGSSKEWHWSFWRRKWGCSSAVSCCWRRQWRGPEVKAMPKCWWPTGGSPCPRAWSRPPSPTFPPPTRCRRWTLCWGRHSCGWNPPPPPSPSSSLPLPAVASSRHCRADKTV